MNEVAEIKNGIIQVTIILLLLSFFLFFLYSPEVEETGGWWFTSCLWITYVNMTLSSLLLVLLSIKIAINKTIGQNNE